MGFKRGYKARLIARGGLVGLIAVAGLFQAPGGHASELNPAAEYLEHKIVIETLILEAQDQGLTGMQAVAEVIRNRAIERGLSAYEVVLQPSQFSAWNNRDRARQWLAKHARAEDYYRANRAWVSSANSNLTGWSTLYWNPALSNPRWARQVERTVKLGDYQFARENR